MSKLELAKIEIVNAKIINVFVGIEDHGILTSDIQLEGDGWGQSFGGYSLSGIAMYVWIKEILAVFEITDWSDLNGMHCRIKRNDREIYEIGNIIKDKWFNPEEAFAKVNK